MCRGDKELLSFRASEDEITGLVPNEKRCPDERVCGVTGIHDRNAVREVVDDIEFAVARDRNRHGFQAHNGFAQELQPLGCDPENFEPIVRRVDGKQELPTRRQREGTHMTGLKIDKRLGGGGTFGQRTEHDERQGHNTDLSSSPLSHQSVLR